MNKKIIPVAMAALLSQSLEGIAKPENSIPKNLDVAVYTAPESKDSVSSEKLVKEAVSHQLKIDKSKVQLKSDLIRDLGADSLDLVEIVMYLEKKCGFELTDDELNGLKKVSDLIIVIDNKKKGVVK